MNESELRFESQILGFFLVSHFHSQFHSIFEWAMKLIHSNFSIFRLHFTKALYTLRTYTFSTREAVFFKFQRNQMSETTYPNTQRYCYLISEAFIFSHDWDQRFCISTYLRVRYSSFVSESSIKSLRCSFSSRWKHKME